MSAQGQLMNQIARAATVRGVVRETRREFLFRSEKTGAELEQFPQERLQMPPAPDLSARRLRRPRDGPLSLRFQAWLESFAQNLFGRPRSG